MQFTFIGATNQYYDSRTLRKVCGILGTIKLISGRYLVVATHREFVGVINNQVIWRLAGHDLIPYIPSSIHLSETQVRYYNEMFTFFRLEYFLLILASFFPENRKSKMRRIFR